MVTVELTQINGCNSKEKRHAASHLRMGSGRPITSKSPFEMLQRRTSVSKREPKDTSTKQKVSNETCARMATANNA